MSDAGHDIDHRETWDVLPWYVNGRLAEPERQRVDAHLRTCAACRNELAVQRQLYTVMAAESTFEHLPTAGLKRLQQRLAAQRTTITANPAAQAARRSSARRSSVRWYPLQGATAASVAIIAAALSVLAGVMWSQSQRRAPSAEYRTVTTETQRPAGEIIRAVFAPTITLSELQVVLDDAQLKIVAGPTEAGVFTLAAAGSRPADWSLQRLRRQSAVRFAEPTVPTPDPTHPR
jgi:hypothetical protein